MCDSAPERVVHLFYSCPTARALWDKLGRWCQMSLPVFVDVEDMWSWIDNLPRTRVHKALLEVLFGCLLWVIWTYRNAVVFGDGSYRKDTLFDNFRLFSFTWYTSRNRRVNSTWNGWLINPIM